MLLLLKLPVMIWQWITSPSMLPLTLTVVLYKLVEYAWSDKPGIERRGLGAGCKLTESHGLRTRLYIPTPGGWWTGTW